MAERGAIPLGRDPSARFLPWLMAFMVFVCTLALAGTLALTHVIVRWDRSLATTLTVQIPVNANGGREALLNEALRVVRDTPGIAGASAVSEQRMAALLAPWLGTDEVVRELPLPGLIDVDIGNRSELDMTRLRQRLAGVAPGITVDDHGQWLGRLLTLGRAVQVTTASIALLVLLATVGVVAYTARTGVAVHRRVIELLHLMGARDTFVAGQFARQAGHSGLIGGAAGVAVAAVALMAIGLLGARIDGRLLPAAGLGLLDWAVLLLLPLAGALIARATAWLTVMRTLARLP
ncbi:MAG: FtsX-like permease family protein [Acetobacterales bacterium]